MTKKFNNWDDAVNDYLDDWEVNINIREFINKDHLISHLKSIGFNEKDGFIYEEYNLI